MTMQTSGSLHELSGDWTIAGVMRQIEYLSLSLEKLPSSQKQPIHIDCRRIEAIDMSGLQLLYVWMECARQRGVQTQLVNLPDGIQQTIQCLGLAHYFADNYSDMV